MNIRTRYAVPCAATVAAVFIALGPGQAGAAEEITQPTKPQSEFSLGGGYVFENNQRFGQFSGMRDDQAYGLIDFSLVGRNDATATWLRFSGRNLGLSDRELRFEHNRQGDWKYFVEYGQTPNYIPYTVSTRLLGAGTSTQTINGLPAPQSMDFSTKRDAISLGFDKMLAKGIDVQVRYRNETKDGSRLWGQGTFGTLNFLTDPIDYRTQQLETTLGYTTERLQLQGGVYGTWFDNNNTALNVNGGVAGLSPMALPPGNQSWQGFFGGGYNFTPDTRSTFKLSYEHQTQNENFIVPSTLTGRSNLGGEVNTLLAQLGISARPAPKLTLRADVRYTDRDDRTPIAQYIPPPGPPPAAGTYDGTNEPRSIESLFGKFEAGYRLPMAFQFIGGVDYQRVDRTTYAVRSVSIRDETTETSYRAELRRSFVETLTGSVAYIYSHRDGSSFQNNQLYGTPPPTFTPGSNNIAPLHLADRDRDRVRLSLNWTPADALAIQFFADWAKDDYDTRDSGLGLLEGKYQNYSIDVSYAFASGWKALAWYSYNTTTADQASCQSAVTSGGACPSTAAKWQANLKNVSNAVGVGLQGKPASRIDVGVDAQYQDLVDKYDQFLLAPTTSTAVVGPLPDITTKLTSVKLWGKYALEKNSGVRVEYVYNRFDTNDWTWTTWTYSDGTTVSQQPLQKVNFVGVSYYYRWQ